MTIDQWIKANEHLIAGAQTALDQLMDAYEAEFGEGAISMVELLKAVEILI